LTLKKVEIIEKADARAHSFDFQWQFNAADLFQAQILTVCQEITGTRYLK